MVGTFEGERPPEKSELSRDSIVSVVFLPAYSILNIEVNNWQTWRPMPDVFPIIIAFFLLRNFEIIAFSWDGACVRKFSLGRNAHDFPIVFAIWRTQNLVGFSIRCP